MLRPVYETDNTRIGGIVERNMWATWLFLNDPRAVDIYIYTHIAGHTQTVRYASVEISDNSVELHHEALVCVCMSAVLMLNRLFEMIYSA